VPRRTSQKGSDLFSVEQFSRRSIRPGDSVVGRFLIPCHEEISSSGAKHYRRAADREIIQGTLTHKPIARGLSDLIDVEYQEKAANAGLCQQKLICVTNPFALDGKVCQSGLSIRRLRVAHQLMQRVRCLVSILLSLQNCFWLVPAPFAVCHSATSFLR
jgi:hypothetical protein